MGFLTNFFNGLGEKLALQTFVQAMLAIVNALLAVSRFIWNGLVNVADFFARGFKFAGDFLRGVWDNFFKKIFGGLLNAVTKGWLWLEDHLDKLLDFLKKVRKWIDRIFNTYIKPILNFIHKIRQVLYVLKLLHIKWAEALDRRLAQIESKIAGVVLEIRGHLNALIDVVSLVIDPGKLIRRPHIIVSISRSIPAIFRATTGMPIGYFLPANSALATSEEKRPSGCGALGDISHIPGLGFSGPFVPSDIGSYFTDAETGVSAGDLAEVQPLAFFDENFIHPLHCLTDTVAGEDIKGDIVQAFRSRSGGVFQLGQVAKDVFVMVHPA
jgi:hypothetical protein